MRICLTGASGFLGRRLLAQLAAEGHAVTALVPPDEDAAFVARHAARVVRGDVAEVRSVADAVAGAERVFHLAGLVSARARDRNELTRVNVRGAQVVAECAVRAGVARLVHCSSVGVYGVPAPGTVDERTPPQPVNAYQASKLAGERAVAAAVAGSDTSAVIARPTALYGDGDRSTLPLFRTVARGRVWLIGHGDMPCQLTHVDDAAALLRACADWSGARDGAAPVLLVGSDERTSVRALIALIAQACGNAPAVVALPRAPLAAAWRVQRALARRLLPLPGRFDGLDFFLADRTVDVAQATRELGVATRVRLADGIRDAVAHARAAGLL